MARGRFAGRRRIGSAASGRGLIAHSAVLAVEMEAAALYAGAPASCAALSCRRAIVLVFAGCAPRRADKGITKGITA
jgi:hypothetical protein